MKYYFHLFSDGEDTSDFIVNEKDYVATVNRIAVCAHICDIVILAWGIEDTHLHILCAGEAENCERFRKMFQMGTKTYITKTRKNDDGKHFVLTMEQIDSESYLKNVATYAIVQATKDGKKIMPYDYKWCSASMYFRTGDPDALWAKDIICSVGSLSINDARIILRTNQKVPSDWLICDGITLAREIRHQYGMGFSQLARRVHLPEVELIKYVK